MNIKDFLCKAKRLDNGNWIEGFLIPDGVSGKYYAHASGNTMNESVKTGEDGLLMLVAFEIDEDTICKYTGFEYKDIADERIEEKAAFTGDIVSAGNAIGVIEYGSYDVEYHCGYYINWVNCSHLCPELSYWHKRVKVIGNIIDNPEMVNGYAAK